jgi:hypothetical protein
MKRSKKQNKAYRSAPARIVIGAATARGIQAENLLNQANGLLTGTPSEEQRQQAHQALQASLNLAIQDASLFVAEQLHHQHERGDLSDIDYEQQMNQALDTVSSLGGNTPPGNGSRDFIYGVNGELIWLGE